jgi:hypothetical protein
VVRRRRRRERLCACDTCQALRGDLSTSPLGCIGTLVSSQLLTWLAYVLLAPVLAVAVSGVYFVTSPRAQPTRDRILASAHGVAIALLYVVAWIALLSAQSNPRLGTPFEFSLLLPLVSSFSRFSSTEAARWCIACKSSTWCACYGRASLAGCSSLASRLDAT